MEEEQQIAPSQRESAPNKKKAVRDLCYIALFAAFITVCAYVAIPVGEISVTLQTLGVCITAGLLGFKRGTLSVLVYILLGVCGLPVFTGFKNFYALLGGASAGYVFGFLFTAVITGIASDRMRKIGDKTQSQTAGQLFQLLLLVLAMTVGVAVCYLFGTGWYLLIYKGSATAENLQIALTYCVYPFILPDLVKIVLSAILVNRVKRFVEKRQ